MPSCTFVYNAVDINKISNQLAFYMCQYLHVSSILYTSASACSILICCSKKEFDSQNWLNSLHEKQKNSLIIKGKTRWRGYTLVKSGYGRYAHLLSTTIVAIVIHVIHRKHALVLKVQHKMTDKFVARSVVSQWAASRWEVISRAVLQLNSFTLLCRELKA